MALNQVRKRFCVEEEEDWAQHRAMSFTTPYESRETSDTWSSTIGCLSQSGAVNRRYCGSAAYVEVLHDCKQHGKKNAHEASVSRIYGTKSDRPVEVGSSLPSSQQGKCFRWNKACGWPPEPLNLNRVDYNCHRYLCEGHYFDLSAPFVCVHVTVSYSNVIA